MTSPLTPTTLPPNLQDRIDRLSEMSAMHIQFVRGVKDVQSWDQLRRELQEGITRIIEEAKT